MLFPLALACHVPSGEVPHESAADPDTGVYVDCSSTYPELWATYYARGEWIAKNGCPFEGDTAANLVAKDCEGYDRWQTCYDCGIEAYRTGMQDGGCE